MQSIADSRFDTVVVGGGPAGIMAALSAREAYPDSPILIIDRTIALGRKILASGAGRCNLTNVNIAGDPHDHYYGAPREFVSGVFARFGYGDIMSFFGDLGILLYEERKSGRGKVFPVTDQAKTVRDLLVDELRRKNVSVWYGTECVALGKDGEGFVLDTRKTDAETHETKESRVYAKHVILAGGGKTYPALGSDGSGYALAGNLGHTLVPPVPCAVPLVGKNPLSQQMQGTKMLCDVRALLGGQTVKTASGDVMFTQYGLSGPAIFDISRPISVALHRENRHDTEVALSFMPCKTSVEIRDFLESRWAKRPDQTVELSLYGILPNKAADAIVRYCGITPGTAVQALTPEARTALISGLSDYRIPVTDTRGWNEAEFTAGGIPSSEVNPSTLESLLVPGLYFAGEILDVDGDVGGYNLSWSWASGYVAGLLGRT